MRPVAGARALAIGALLSGLAAAAEPGREDFERGRRLVDANCGDCLGATRPGLEDGVAALRRALGAGFADPASIYRLLAEAYPTLAHVYSRHDPEAIRRFETLRRDALARLAVLTPDDPWPRYELAVSEPDRDAQPAALGRLLGERPRHAEAHAAVATILAERGRLAEAVLTTADYRRAGQAVDGLLWGARPETDGNLVPGAQTWFEWMTFDVELCRPGAPAGEDGDQRPAREKRRPKGARCSPLPSRDCPSLLTSRLTSSGTPSAPSVRNFTVRPATRPSSSAMGASPSPERPAACSVPSICSPCWVMTSVNARTGQL